MCICASCNPPACVFICKFFFFNDTSTTEIYTLSLHDALPISGRAWRVTTRRPRRRPPRRSVPRSEEHTSELQSRQYIVCRLLLEKKKKKTYFFSVQKKKKKNKTKKKKNKKK